MAALKKLQALKPLQRCNTAAILLKKCRFATSTHSRSSKSKSFLALNALSQPHHTPSLCYSAISSIVANTHASQYRARLGTVRHLGRRRDRDARGESTGSRLDKLENDAEGHPNDPSKQALFYEALLKESPQEVVRRFESAAYASNDTCVKTYVKALIESKRMTQTNLSYVLKKEFERMQRGSLGSPAGMGMGMGGGFGDRREFSGSEDTPLVVTMQEPPFKTSLWRFIRTLVIALVVISALSQLVEESGIGPRGMVSSFDTKPETPAQAYTFDDVQGADEAKDDLQQVVEFLRNPEEFTRLGGKLPKGVLLMGPPGTGKTLLARAVAGEAGVPFYYCSASEFDEMFVGVGARRVRELFSAAKKKSPAIIFIDEIDAVGGRRSDKDQQYSKMTLNQLLVELDGFHKEDAVVVIAATNFPEMLDKALIRPGRFDNHVNVPLPDLRGRAAILEVHAREMPIDNARDSLWKIARGTPGFSGAELANLVNQAALKASSDHKDSIDIATLEWAKDKIMMGAERNVKSMQPEVRRNTAYHEAGHALCALLTEGATPVYKATIVPRGRALGMVMQVPEDDVYQQTKKEMEARMVVAMGGYAAEEKMFGKENVSSGPSNDLEQATKLARTMVTKFAFSDKVGPISIGDDEKPSAQTSALIDSEVKRLCQESLDKARNLLYRYDREHRRIADALLEFETLTEEEMRRVMKGEKLDMVQMK
eukprot:m.21932 g.21932  ORF g.21932 m.21932 type:complete len:711 (+) comp7286_c0_seq1:152-2284(+)